METLFLITMAVLVGFLILCFLFCIVVAIVGMITLIKGLFEK